MSLEPENDYPTISPWKLMERLFKSQPTQIITYNILEYCRDVEFKTGMPVGFEIVSPISYRVYLKVIQ